MDGIAEERGWERIKILTDNIYSDSGLFGVYAETNSAPGRLAQQIVSELAKLRNPLSAEDLNRGKAANKVSVLDMRRTPTLEFIGAQVLAGGKAVTPEEYLFFLYILFCFTRT